jgi:hypothetical protein
MHPVDVWMKLYACLLALIPRLNRSIETCKKKFNTLFKQYKVDKMANSVSGTVMKHVSASTNDSDHISLENSQLPEDNQVLEDHPIVQEPSSSFITSPLISKSGKKLYQEQTYHMFTQMVENSLVMV